MEKIWETTGRLSQKAQAAYFRLQKRIRKSLAPASLSDVAIILKLYPHLQPSGVEAYRSELINNRSFFDELNGCMLKIRQREADWKTGRGWDTFLYLAVRFARPRIVFESGVFDGQSSAVILQALSDNGMGQLVSVDLPAGRAIRRSTEWLKEPNLPIDCSPGWAIPASLRGRHHLVLGDSREKLPVLFNEHPEIDIFFHDSLHAFAHQYFEYTLAWRHLREGGLLLSDDIFWSGAFRRFCKEANKAYLRLGGFGIVRK